MNKQLGSLRMNSTGLDGGHTNGKRYAESGLEGLKNLPRTGRPPQISGQKFAEIKRELSENLAGWRAKEVMNIIYEKTGKIS